MRRSVLLLFLVIGALFAQPGGPHIIFGTVQTLEHTTPECFQLTVTRDGIETVVDFDAMGNEYDPDYSDTAGLFIVTLEDVNEGEIIEFYLKDLCLME